MNDIVSRTRHSLSSFEQDGATLVRANVWTASGYSSKTFANASEARGWIDAKLRGETKADKLEAPTPPKGEAE